MDPSGLSAHMPSIEKIEVPLQKTEFHVSSKYVFMKNIFINPFFFFLVRFEVHMELCGC